MTQDSPNFEKTQLVLTLSTEDTWMTPIIQYLQVGNLPTTRSQARKILRQASRYTMQGGILYRRGFSNPLLRCVAGKEVKETLSNVHQGSCGDHTGGQTLAKKILRYGYFCPTLSKDAIEFARRCDKCQRFAKIPRQPPTELTQWSAHGHSQFGE